MNNDFDQQLDTTDLQCPLPLITTKKTLESMQSGKVLKIISVDSSLLLDLQVLAKQAGHSLLHYNKHDEIYVFFLQKQ
ncbi:MAG: hypothetical protein COC15_00330 [Legionellales bacterium]|nr:MAG: hypothetical protein COC15_00330 [Legionellales bacterium]